MKVSFSKDFNSIGQFKDIDLPDFTVLTGLNGSGKTHLMKAIKAGAVTIDSVPIHEVAYYTYHDFIVPKPEVLNSQQIKSHRNQTWQYFNGEVGNPKINWKRRLLKLYEQYFLVGTGESRIDLLENALKEGVSIWEISKKPSLVSEDIFKKVSEYLVAVKEQVFADKNFRKIPYFLSLIKALRKMSRSLHLMDEEDFKELFVPSTKSSNHLASSLGVIFTKYKANQFLWASRQWDSGDTSKSKIELYEEYENKYEKPWDVINQILSDIHKYAGKNLVFNFSVTSPNSNNLNMENWQSFSYVPKLIDNNENVERDFELLSSGEQTLLALAISTYEARDDFAFPELLLLDEIDASLHPSMIRALLETIKKTFLHRGTKVILATHSPTTISMSEEGQVFVVNKGKQENKIEQSSKKAALEFLTEGFATLENGLAIFNEIAKHDICIITEGRNSNYLRKALKVFKQSDVEVVSGLEAVTGKDQLKTLFRIFCVAPIAKPVLFIWDCDVKFKLEETNNAFVLILPENDKNSISIHGIENMFPEHLFNDFITETIDSRGKATREFDARRKSDFELHVLNNASDSDFDFFKVVIDKLDNIRGSGIN